MRTINSLTRIVLFAGAGLALLPWQASAADFTPDASRVLSDPSFLPLQGQTYGATAYTYGNTTGDVNNYLGVLNRTFDTTSNTLSQALSYGITNDLSLGISESYAQNYTANNYTSGTTTSTKSTGFSDPIVGMTWRMLDQEQHSVNWDLIGNYSPNVIRATGASPTQDGSMARGGSMTNLGMAISHKTKDFTIYVDAFAQETGNRSIINANGSTTSYQPGRLYSFALQTQTRLSRNNAINLGLTRAFNQNVNAVNDTTLAAFTSMPANVTTINLGLVHHFIYNKVVGVLSYSHSIYSTSSVNYATSPTSNTATINESADVFGVRLQYVF